MRLLLLLLSSQISAELMSLKCEFEYKTKDGQLTTLSKKYFFDKNQGEIADVEIYNFSEKLDRTLVGKPLSWSPSYITIKYSEDGLLTTVYYTDVINRKNLSYQTSAIHGDQNWDYYGKCKVVEIDSNNF